jgi:hypothetical protein
MLLILQYAAIQNILRSYQTSFYHYPSHLILVTKIVYQTKIRSAKFTSLFQTTFVRRSNMCHRLDLI